MVWSAPMYGSVRPNVWFKGVECYPNATFMLRLSYLFPRLLLVSCYFFGFLLSVEWVCECVS